jgi:Na+/melibiose symporter-like transporter
VCGVFLGAVIFSNFFLLTLYVQQVVGYSALKTGLTFLATAGTVIPVAGLSQALVTRYGPRPIMSIGLTLIGGALSVAIAATVAFTHMNSLLASGQSPAEAQTSGFALAFWVIAGIWAASVVACLVLVRGRELEEVDTESVTYAA